MTNWSELYTDFFKSVAACTMFNLPIEVQEDVLQTYVKIAVSRFRRPAINLAYENIDEEFYFVETLGDGEKAVIVAHMVAVWNEFQGTREENYVSLAYDKDISKHSQGAFIVAINKRIEMYREMAAQTEANYYRGLAKLTDLNE